MKKTITLLAMAFCLNINAQYTKLLDFGKDTLTGQALTGQSPWGNFISDGTFLYGMTNLGGTSNNGSIFKIKPDGTGYDTLLNFNGTNGANPYGSLIIDGTFLYGMTYNGGANNDGNIFKIKTDGTGFNTLMNFNGTNGSNPHGSLYYDGTSFLYGMTTYGGTFNNGLVFKIKTNGTSYDTIMNFNFLPTNTNGANPYGSLIFDGTYLYGTTVNGGPLQSCIVFKIKPDGTGFTDILDFNVINGDYPQGSLVSDGTFLYGMSSAGGNNCSGGGCGTIFKLKPDGTGFDTLLDFSKTNGANPRGDLYYDGTYLYGMTFAGGANGYGIIFKIKPDGSGYVDLYDFKPVPDGGNPNGSLLFDGGCLYGMTLNGGINNLGSAFKYCLSGVGINQFEGNNNQINIYPNPTSDQFFIETNATDKLNVDLYDVNGRHVFSASVSDKETINVATLDNGAYTLTIKTADRVINKKLVILR